MDANGQPASAISATNVFMDSSQQYIEHQEVQMVPPEPPAASAKLNKVVLVREDNGHGGQRPPKHFAQLGARPFRNADPAKAYTYGGKTYEGGYLAPECETILDSLSGEGGLEHAQYSALMHSQAWYMGLPYSFQWQAMAHADVAIRELHCKALLKSGATEADFNERGWKFSLSIPNKINAIKKGKAVGMGLPPSMQHYFSQQDGRIPPKYYEAEAERADQPAPNFRKYYKQTLADAESVLDAQKETKLKQAATKANSKDGAAPTSKVAAIPEVEAELDAQVEPLTQPMSSLPHPNLAL
jgi:hypothetical protein